MKETDPSKAAPKVFVIGIDGASFNILNGFLSRGQMPKLAQLIKTGASGELTVDTNDRGWATLFTGRDASVHKGFYWVPKRECYGLSDTYSIADYDHLTVWRTLEKSGGRSGIIGLPTTYPPPAIDGFVISSGGGGTSPRLEDAIYPRSLLQRYQKLRDYKLDVRYDAYAGGKAEEFFADLIDTVRRRAELALEIFQNEPVDLAILAFEGPDRMLHWFYDEVMEVALGNAEDSALASLIEDYYAELDRVVGQVSDAYGDDSIIYIVSDHGFTRHSYDVYINTVLTELGLAAPVRSLKNRVREFILNFAIDRLPASWRVRLKKSLKWMNKSSHTALMAPALNWSKTKVFGHSGRGLYINKRGLYPHGIVDESEHEDLVTAVISALESYPNPVTGNRLFSLISRRKDLYEGPASDLAPDIIFDLPEGYDISRRIAPTGSSAVEKRHPAIRAPNAMPKKRMGVHSSRAIFIASKKSSMRGELSPKPLRAFYGMLMNDLELGEQE